jgi:hypothetical protein
MLALLRLFATLRGTAIGLLERFCNRLTGLPLLIFTRLDSNNNISIAVLGGLADKSFSLLPISFAGRYFISTRSWLANIKQRDSMADLLS